MKTIGLQIIPFRQIVEISSRPNTPRGCTEYSMQPLGGCVMFGHKPVKLLALYSRQRPVAQAEE